MSNNQIQYINFNVQAHPDILAVANELAELEQRKPHDSIRLLILEAGGAKIERLKASSNHTETNTECQEENL